LHYEDQKRIAVTYQAFQTGNVLKTQFRESQNAIFEAQNQLKSYIDWNTEQDIRERSPIIPYTIEFYFPCIVFQGPMYEAVVENGDVRLGKSDHIILKTLFKSPYSIYEKDLLIDVVSEEYFNNYQDLIRKDLDSLKESILKNSERISGRITEMVSLLESAKRG
jgi:hypothetical protein